MSQGTIITIEIFADTVKTAMEAYYGDDYAVTVQKVHKNNGVVLTGLTILKRDCNIAPTIYLNQAFEQYQEGRTLESICREVIRIYEDNKVQRHFDLSCVTDFSKVQNRICYKLVNANKNRELLANAPHVLVEDLAVIFYILMSNEDEGAGTITIKNNLVEIWKVDTDTLYELALANTQRLYRGTVQSMADMVKDILADKLNEEYSREFFDMMVDAKDRVPMYVCTNTKKIHGAGVILYKGLLQEFSERLNSDVFILPSSIHETLLIPANNYWDIEYLREMVRSVNRTDVAPDEILSDNVYYYNRLTDHVELV